MFSFCHRGKRNTSSIDNYGGRRSKVQEMHWYLCIPVSGASNAEHDSQCIPLLLFPDHRREESIRGDLRDRYQTEPERFS